MMRQFCLSRITSFLLIFLMYQSVMSDGRVVRGGGGFAEMQAQFALVALPDLVSTCLRMPHLCKSIAASEHNLVQAMSLHLNGNKNTSFYLNHLNVCTGSAPAYDLTLKQLTVESCLLYNAQEMPIAYEDIFELVFTTVCHALAPPTLPSACPQVFKKLASDIRVDALTYTLYQDLKPLRLQRLNIATSHRFEFHLAIEYFSTSFDLTEVLILQFQCIELTGFEINSIQTQVVDSRQRIHSDVQIRWSCRTSKGTQTYSARLLIDLPIDETKFQFDPAQFQLISRRKE